MNRKAYLLWLFSALLLGCFALTGGVFAEDAVYVPLREWFGFEDPEGLVQAIDLPPVTHHGIEIELREILIENNRVHLSVMVKSDRIEDVNSLQLGHIENGLRIGLLDSFDLDGSSWSSATYNLFPDLKRDGFIQVVLTAVVPDSVLSGDKAPMRLLIDAIRVPVEGEMMGAELQGFWGFKFTADLKKPKELTREVALDYPFVGDGELYTAFALTSSPVRSRISVERAIPNRIVESEDFEDDFWLYSTEGNLLGFVVADENGNRIEAAYPEYDYRSDQPKPVVEIDYFSTAENNGWTWLKEAKEITVTPVMTSLAGPQNMEADGIDRYLPLEPIQVKTASEPTEIETFMEDFEPDYTLYGGLDTRNAYVKPVRLMQTTKNGLTVMLDKVLVTEDNIYISVLMGIAEKNGKNLVVPSDFQINGYDIDVSPVVPYPPDYFEIKLGGGGGGGPYINVLHEDPLVVYDGIGKGLMYTDGYVSVKDPMHVRVKINRVQVCWDEEIAPQSYTSACYSETEPLTFEFDTDGAELAKLTKEIELDETVDVEGTEIKLNRLRFNPMELLLFTNDYAATYEDHRIAYVETDDGTRLQLYSRSYPFARFSMRTIDPQEIAALEKTERLKIGFCAQEMIKVPGGYTYSDLESSNCDPAWSTVIDLN